MVNVRGDLNWRIGNCEKQMIKCKLDETKDRINRWVVWYDFLLSFVFILYGLLFVFENRNAYLFSLFMDKINYNLEKPKISKSILTIESILTPPKAEPNIHSVEYVIKIKLYQKDVRKSNMK